MYEKLDGKTYKIKTPQSDHAIYITINNVVKNDHIQPYEIFINTKNINNYIWLVSLSCMISFILRKADDLKTIQEAIDELLNLHDPNGGYFRKGQQIPSIVSDIGNLLNSHIQESNKGNK